MAREWVKCRCGPRISQSPLSGSCQCLGEVVDQGALQRPGVVVCLERRPSRAFSSAIITSPSTSFWRCSTARVADPDGPRAGVAGQVVQGALGQVAAAVDGVHDLQVLGVAGDRAEQPVAPQPGLVGVAGVDQRLEGERGVAQPAVAVVPVALAAEVLGQRGRRGGDDPARLARGSAAAA